MRNLYKEFFYVSENEKIRDKVMMTRVTVTVISIVLCLASLGITAYAYFSCDLASEYNIIKSANYELDIKMVDESGNTVAVKTDDQKVFTASLKANEKYVVTAKPGAESTAKTGFIILEDESGKNRFHTAQIGMDGNKVVNSLSFTLTADADTRVILYAHWGTSSYYGDENSSTDLYVGQGETAQISVPGGKGKSELKSPVAHAVASGENLTKIAKLYDTTPERIAAYNDITDLSVLRTGLILLIPDESWEMPEDFEFEGTETEKTEPTTQTPPVTEETPPTTTSPTPGTTEVPEEKTEPEATPELEAKPEETTPAEETNS